MAFQEGMADQDPELGAAMVGPGQRPEQAEGGG